jgi:hypothetical protein
MKVPEDHENVGSIRQQNNEGYEAVSQVFVSFAIQARYGCPNRKKPADEGGFFIANLFWNAQADLRRLRRPAL